MSGVSHESRPSVTIARFLIGDDQPGNIHVIAKAGDDSRDETRGGFSAAAG